MSNKILVVFHNGSNYGYHFVIKELTNDFKCQFECLEENTEKYKKFSVLIVKEIKKFDKDGNEDITTVSYKIKFIDFFLFIDLLIFIYLLIVQDLLEVHYQILSVISQKEFIKLDAMIVIVFLFFNMKV